MKLSKKAGATSEIWQIFIADSSSTTGAGLTGLTNASSGLTAYFHRDTDTTATAMALVTMTVGTFTSLGFKEIDATNMPGWYQLCPPNAALAAGAKSCGFLLKGATNMAPLPIEVQLQAFDIDTATVTVGTNNDKTGYALSAAGVQAMWDALTSALTTVGSVGKRIADNLDAAITSRSTYAGGAVASVTAGVTVTTNNDKTGYGLSAAAVQAIWDALTSALTTVGSIGKRIADNLDATISSRGTSTYAGADTAGTTTLLARLTATRAGNLDFLDTAVSGVAAAVWAVGTRSLTTFGTLVADVATAVWGAATRTLSAFGFSVTVGTNTDKTGYALTAGEHTAIQTDAATGILVTPANKLATDGSNRVTVGSNADKTGYNVSSINLNVIDAVALDASAGQEIADRILARNVAGGSDGGTRTVQNALRRLVNRVKIAAGVLSVYQEDDTTAALTQAVTTTAGNPITEVDTV